MEDNLSVDKYKLMDSTASKIQLQKAFAELESHRAITLNLKWKQLEEHFNGLQKSLKRRFTELEEQEKDFQTKIVESKDVLEKRKAAVCAKAQVSLEMLQEKRDAAVSAILTAREKHGVIDNEVIARSRARPRQDSASWWAVEDTALLSAYINVTTNSRVGMNQRQEGVWSKVYKLYSETQLQRPGEIRPRTLAMLKGRYGRIQTAVNRFNGHFTEMTRMLGNRSGFNDEEIFAEAKKLFEVEGGVPFKLEHVWRMMETHPKWAQTDSVDKGKGKAGHKKWGETSRMMDSDSGSDKRFRVNEGGDYTQSPLMKRPECRDTTKTTLWGSRKGRSSGSSSHDERGVYAESIQAFNEKHQAANDFEREKLKKINARKEREANMSFAETLIKKEIAGFQLTESEVAMKEFLMKKICGE